MISEIKITNRAECSVVEIEGVIGMPERLQFQRPTQRIATYARFREKLDEISMIEAPEIVVNIRSTGGDVNDALLIYEALRGLKGVVTTHCYGYVASAATIIAQAASEGRRELSTSTLYLVHRSKSEAQDGEKSNHTQELLSKTDRQIAEIYAARAGRQVSDFEALMAENGGRGRWLTAQEAVEAGLADVVVASEDAMPKNSVSQEIMELLGLPELPELLEAAKQSEVSDNEDVRVRGWYGFVKILHRIFEKNRATVQASANAKTETQVAGAARAENAAGVQKSAETAEKEGAAGEKKEEKAAGEKRKVATAKSYENMPKNRVPRGLAAQAASAPTLTIEVDDPSPFDYTPTPNEAAYEADLDNVKLRIEN